MLYGSKLLHDSRYQSLYLTTGSRSWSWTLIMGNMRARMARVRRERRTRRRMS